jgi:hypothetical protein
MLRLDGDGRVKTGVIELGFQVFRQEISPKYLHRIIDPAIFFRRIPPEMLMGIDPHFGTIAPELDQNCTPPNRPERPNWPMAKECANLFTFHNLPRVVRFREDNLSSTRNFAPLIIFCFQVLRSLSFGYHPAFI